MAAESMPVAISEYSFIPLANLTIDELNLPNVLLPVIKSVIAAMNPVPVIISTAFDNSSIPCVKEESMDFDPLMNGSRFIMKSDKYVPILGSIDVAPSAIPPAIPPIN